METEPNSQDVSEAAIAKAQNCIHKLGSALPNLCLRCGWDWYKNGDIPEHPEEAAARELQQAQEKNVHTEHCCGEHGCKYGDAACHVASGKQEQSFPCEDCATPQTPALGKGEW